MPKYCENCTKSVYREGSVTNHMFSLAFSVDSEFESSDDCLTYESKEVMAKLLERVADLLREDGDSIFEAFYCEDSYDILPEDHTKNA